MTEQRALAYRRVLDALDALGPSKLHASEQQRIRDAADCLLFSDAPSDEAAHHALEDVERLCRQLVDAGRFQRATALGLADDVAHCGPPLVPDLESLAA